VQINILGTRGIPASHGGFESFAHELAPYLVARGHAVLVYCQLDEGMEKQWIEDKWRGVTRRHYLPKHRDSLGTMEFDLACVVDVLKQPGVDLVLGYNTAVFNVIERLNGRRVFMNMDGIEWKRTKWSLPAKIWFFINELVGANSCSLPIADHPEIARHISKRCLKDPVMIPYGSDKIESADITAITRLGLVPDKYLVSICRIEPENSILELVEAFSSLETDTKYVVLGKMDPTNHYHVAVMDAGGPNVIFAGAIYDNTIVKALRFYCRAYLHGHQVGGTNPSLVEAMGAGNAVIAHNNKFNRWTAGDEQFYFHTKSDCVIKIREVLVDDERVSCARTAVRQRFQTKFQWEMILNEYEQVLCSPKIN
jgi:glycosyltransferase involved in cell wall biosynthesis